MDQSHAVLDARIFRAGTGRGLAVIRRMTHDCESVFADAS